MMVVLEGLDGAGKRTQAHLLEQAALEKGLTVATLSFPRYGKTLFSNFIQQYLGGNISDWARFSPAASALMFAGDRLESSSELWGLCRSQDLLIIDRYVASNAAYQGARCTDETERIKFSNWVFQLEYGFFGLPKPDLTVYLDIPEEIAVQRTRRRGTKFSSGHANEDIYELDIAYLKKCRDAYGWLAKEQMDGRWYIVSTVDEQGAPRELGVVATTVWGHLSGLLNQLG